MKIKSVELKNFKRFTHLVIENIPETAKLVVLLGPNGCGKSSVFDAFHAKSYDLARMGMSFEVDYHWKTPGHQHRPSIEFHNLPSHPAEYMAKGIYVRTAHRNDPNVNVRSITALGSSLQERRFQRMTENDAAVSGNYQRLVSNTLTDVFVKGDENTTFKRYRNDVLGEIQSAMRNLFDDLVLNSLGNPLRDRTFTFDKGDSKQFNYKNLSGGERAAFDLLLDMFVKREEYDDTVFCIDEPEIHISPRIQALLLEELFRLINEKSQLWIATHAIGMMRKAMELDKKYPGEVVFLDFGDQDFDILQRISPTKPSREFWERTHLIALDDLSELLAPNRIILCESKIGFDADCYNQIFNKDFPDTKFVSAGGKKELILYVPVAEAIAKGAECLRLRDRDNLTDIKIAELREEGIRVLENGSIEDYLLSDDVLRVLCDSLRADSEDIPIDGEKQLIKTRGNFPNGKAAVASIRRDIINWGVQNIGDDKDDFLRHTMAPCVKPETETYKELREIIFGNGQ